MHTAPAELDAATQSALVRALAAALAQRGEEGSAAPPRHIETHISHVLLAGGFAFKIKKAITTSFLDQGTLARRRAACFEELRLNRRLAPELYLDVVEIRGTPRAPRLVVPAAGPAAATAFAAYPDAAAAASSAAAAATSTAGDFGGASDRVIEVAVRMRRFDEAGLWDRLARRGELGAADIDELAALLARFHAEAAVAPVDPTGGLGQPGTARQALLDSLADLQRGASMSGTAGTAGTSGSTSSAIGWPDAAGLALLQRLREWEAGAFERAAPAMARRLVAGRVRECHGDLHLGNVARAAPVTGGGSGGRRGGTGCSGGGTVPGAGGSAGRCLVFDGIEFNDAFRWLDVIDEVAFMTMDLHAHGLPALAHRFVNAYLEASGDYDGVHVLGYYLVHRALVRAKVARLRLEQAAGAGGDEAERGAARAQAQGYLALAGRLAAPRRRAFFITHGLSGSGKTTLTQGLVEAAGALRVRADVERKRLAGLPPLASSRGWRAPGGTDLYGAAMNEATQARLLAAAADVVGAADSGWPVIVDATFIRRHARDEARQCAARLGVPFFILRLEAPPAVLRERVRSRRARGDDASEADEAVLAAQQQALEPLAADEMEAVFEVRPGPAVIAAPLAAGAAPNAAPNAASIPSSIPSSIPASIPASTAARSAAPSAAESAAESAAPNAGLDAAPAVDWSPLLARLADRGGPAAAA